MKAYVSLGSLVLALVPALALAQQPAACERVQFSEEVLARFPNIRQACLDVINKDGQDYVVVKANLVRATPRRMTVQIKRPDGTLSDPIGINVKSNARLNINGKMTPGRGRRGRPGTDDLRQRQGSGHRARLRRRDRGVHAGAGDAGAGAGARGPGGGRTGDADDRDATAACGCDRAHPARDRCRYCLPAPPQPGLKGE